MGQLLNTFVDVPAHDLCGPLAVLLRLHLRGGSVLTQEDGHLWSHQLTLYHPGGCSQPDSEMLLKNKSQNDLCCTWCCLWPCTLGSPGRTLGFGAISSGHQGFWSNTRKGDWFSTLFYWLYVSETLLKSVELHCHKTPYNGASIRLDIFNVDKVNTVNVNRVQSSRQDWPLASLICLSRSHLNSIIFLKLFYHVIFLGIIRIKFSSQITPQTQAYPCLNIGIGIKNTMLKWYPLKWGTKHKKACQFPIRRVRWRLGDWKHWLQPISFFYLLIHFVQTIWTFGTFSSKYVKCSFRKELPKPQIIS